MYVEMYYAYWLPYAVAAQAALTAAQPIGPSSGLGQPAGLPELHGLVDSVARDVLRSGRGQVRSGHIRGLRDPV